MSSLTSRQVTSLPGQTPESGSVRAEGPTAGRPGEEALFDDGMLSSLLHLLKRAGVVFVVQAFGAGASYALQVLLARLLGASSYGLYAAIFVWVGFLALIVGIGFPASSVRFIPHYRIQRDWSRLNGFVQTASRVTFASAAALTLVMLIVIAGLHFAGEVIDPIVYVLAALIIPALAGSILYTELERAEGRVAIAFAPSLIARPLMIGLGSAALFLLSDGTLSTTAALIATLIAAYAVLFAQWALARRSPVRELPTGERINERREWFGVGVSLLAASAFTLILMQVDIVLVAAMRGSREAGIYAAASKTATLVTFVIWAVNAAAVPQFASLWSLGRVEELQRLVSRLAGAIFWPSLAISLVLAVLSGPVLALFGAQFVEAQVALLILLVGQMVNAAAGSVGYLLIVTGHHREATVVLALSALLSIGLAAAGIVVWGITGAAVGTTVGFLLWNGGLYWLVVRKLKIHASIFTAIRASRIRAVV